MSIKQQKKDLVRLTTQDLDNARVVTDSLQVAEKFGKRHKNVIRAIENLDCSLEFSRLNFEPSEYLDSQNKSQPMYEITRYGLVFLIMGFTGKEAARFKEDYIKAFNMMEKELLHWSQTRGVGKRVRRDLTDVIKTYVNDENSKFKSFAYSNYTNTIYKYVLGGSNKQIKQKRGLTKDDNLRSFLTEKELLDVQKAEEKIAQLLEMKQYINKSDKEMYTIIKEMLSKEYQKNLDK